MQNTFVVSKIELKKMITSLGVSDGSVEVFLGKLDKMHMHVDAVSFVGMLGKLGIRNKDISNILRRIGVGDTSISEVFNTLDEEKIEETYGKVARINLVEK